MAKQLPAVIKNYNVFVDSDTYAGVAKSLTLPTITKKTEDFRGAGMLADIGLDMGFEKMELTVTYVGIDSRLFSQLSYCAVDALPIRFVGAYERQDTCEHIVREVYMRGSMSELPLGDVEMGSLSETECKYDVTYLRVSENGYDLLEIDAINGIYNVGGIDKTGEINSLLGL